MRTHFDPIIYIVDSNQYYQKIILTCLEALNYKNVTLFYDGESCLNSTSQIPDIVVLDYNLGEGKLNGIETMKRFSGFSKTPNFIFLSSNIKVDIAVDAIRGGASDYILKSKSGLMRLAKQVDILQNKLQNQQNKQARQSIATVH
jgi:two-component system, NtrC family, response regulator AtoC